ncbi:holocytochrome c synthase [Yamadazyma tenuis]|uniref:Holocytochrome c-type synthase n=1 Tax=Candida tenuis (strain ATCC 10573 / BCRC 21748 / CBS 615 / JCM 9827 / NBRC 10315 / NRRL Y-1498 / VKM Y-70) TaxID=590646 RepID=G3B3C3_CANTC|nr:cytochrome c and c1 heme-lyase [Yamadazyma tenuis ATCC 10573]XP_006686688.1 uncharacterized protein CANTEDRAFT_114157 [Yamadazyma tenuis ATCC 10573]EGV64373.1 cytochrome c and c1 heme-lyase [Yamadazyma tenuis ATCC 10573]EGV64374.1 hypothetical protein CANTEDRAFT_114157 [Yamadazyma tenuis ATCC 10573]WEJ96228.1 holocytochrome c synthase [Yamadazyma tenuis]
MGLFWADKYPSPATSPAGNTSSGLAKCPIDHSAFSAGQTCPVRPKDSTSSADELSSSILNPMNNMPIDISTDMAPGQKIHLSTERTISSIPRGETASEGLWEYPSPQQMLNAMLRKGKGQGIDETAVESMVEIHNFLNEGAWQQILEWEDIHTKQTKIEPRLLKFTGRPHDLSPRASTYLWLSKFFPNTFNSNPPFDRHDWTVLRATGESPPNDWRKVRYVIDYYSAPDDEETGMPSFVLDTRPALDSPVDAYDRFVRLASPLWKQAMGDFSK